MSLSQERYEIVIGPGLQQFLEFWKINHYSKFLKDFKEWVKEVICLERPAQCFLDLSTVPVNHLSGQTFRKLPHNLCYAESPKRNITLLLCFPDLKKERLEYQGGTGPA